MSSSEIKKHWSNVNDLGCIITGNPFCELHHCFGGSMRDIGIHKGMGQKVSDWLVIPLSAELHRGKDGVHSGVLTFEKIFSTQYQFLCDVSDMLDVDVFKKAGYIYDCEFGRYEKI